MPLQIIQNVYPVIWFDLCIAASGECLLNVIFLILFYFIFFVLLLLL